MRYIISEKQYRLISEQGTSNPMISGAMGLVKGLNTNNQTQEKPTPVPSGQPIKIDLPKDEKVLQQYCKPKRVPMENIIKVDQKEIESYTNIALRLVRDEIKKNVKGVDKKNSIFDKLMPSLSKVMSKVEDEIIPIMHSSMKKIALSKNGYLNYDMTEDANRMAKIFYDILDDEFNTTAYRAIASLKITPKNKQEVIEEVQNIFKKIQSVLARTEMSGNWLHNYVNYKFLESLPDEGRCKNILVVKENGYKVTPYHPSPGYFKSENIDKRRIDTESIVKPYYDKIVSLVNNLA